MPTYLRLFIVLGEVIGFCVFSVHRCKKFYKEYKKDKKDKDKRKAFNNSLCFYVTCVCILLFIFIFTFPSYIFLSYNKLIIMTAVIVTLLIQYILEIYIDSIYAIIGIFMYAISLFLALFVLVGVYAGFYFCEGWIQFTECINEEKNIEIIHPVMNLSEKSKIGYTENDDGKIDRYIFFYQDDSGSWYSVNEFIQDKELLSNDESSYVEKYITRKTFINYELSELDDNYKTTEEEIVYKLYCNPNELIKID